MTELVSTMTRNINNTTLGYCCFSLLHKIFQEKYSRKQSDNLISGIHAASALVLANTSLYHLRWVSTASFLFDTIQMIQSGKIGLLQCGYIYHHLASIYLLGCDSREVPIDQIFFWGELSNIFNYPLYHYIHEKREIHTKKIEVLRDLQKILYAWIRLPICTRQMYHFIRKTEAPHHLYALCPVYIMGIIWSMKILSQ